MGKMQPARSRDLNLGPNYQCSESLPLGCWWAYIMHAPFYLTSFALILQPN
ncbi:hypothetical protein X975_01956, partial [Stegodyphus mimosarum]